MKPFEVTEQKVKLWAEAKGIYEMSTAAKQLEKTAEECVELAVALGRGDRVEVQDAIGDIQVTLVNVCHLMGTSIVECFQAYSMHKIGTFGDFYVEFTGQYDSGLHSTEELIARLGSELMDCALSIGKQDMGVFVISITHIYKNLYELCVLNQLTLEECFDSAYDVISKRSGAMVNGTFVKNA